MNGVLWVVQCFLALVFVITGMIKLALPKEKLETRMKWVKDFSQPVVRAIGFVEILGGLGLVLPSLTGILPWLTPLAAAGLVLVMIGASLANYRTKEYPMIGMNVVLLALALVVSVGRFWVSPL